LQQILQPHTRWHGNTVSDRNGNCPFGNSIRPRKEICNSRQRLRRFPVDNAGTAGLISLNAMGRTHVQGPALVDPAVNSRPVPRYTAARIAEAILVSQTHQPCPNSSAVWITACGKQWRNSPFRQTCTNSPSPVGSAQIISHYRKMEFYVVAGRPVGAETGERGCQRHLQSRPGEPYIPAMTKLSIDQRFSCGAELRAAHFGIT